MLQRIRQRIIPTEAGSTSSLANRLLRRMPPPTTYLEVGVASGKTLVRVGADRLIGVDPSPEPFVRSDRCTLHQISSNDYFREMAHDEAPFSAAFVDGLHLWEACLEDILSAFEHLEPTGFVIVDDVYPPGLDEAVRAATFEEAARIARSAGQQITSWMGDVWRAIFLLTHAHVPGLRWATIPITQDRFHTVFWWSKGRVPSVEMRASLSEAQLQIAATAPVTSIGDFTRRGMARWYRYQPYWRFMLSLRWREYRQTMSGRSSR